MKTINDSALLPGNFPRRLVMRLGHLGDVVLTTGLMEYFGRRWACQFDVLTREQWAPLFDNNPHVGRVWAAHKQDLGQPALYGYLRELSRHYSSQDTLFDLHGVLRSRLLGVMWPGHVARYHKLGMERRLFLFSQGKLCAEKLRTASVLQRYASAFTKEYVEEGNVLPRIYLSDQERLIALEQLTAACPEIEKQNSPVVALHPFATHQSKTWPLATWRSVANSLSQQKIPWIVIGMGSSEQAEAWGQQQNFINRTSLRELAALLAQCSVLVTGDSGPMHVARAVGTRVVALFGPTIREWGFFPTASEGIVLESAVSCRPCSLHGAGECRNNHRCLENISVRDVVQAVHSILDTARA